MSQFAYKFSYRRDLPHIQPVGATLFVTFRLFGSLPREVIERWQAEKRWLGECLKRLEPSDVGQTVSLPESQTDSLPESEESQTDSLRHRQYELHRRWFARFESLLDKADTGPTWLKDGRIAEMVADSLHYRDGKVYRLDAFSIMPNHVHVVFAPLPVQRSVAQTVSLHDGRQTNSLSHDEYYSLPKIMQSLKGFTSREANRLLGRSGTFWEHESYDHFVRDADEWKRIIAYVLNNPVKAGFVKDWKEWKWSYCRPQTNRLRHEVAQAAG